MPVAHLRDPRMELAEIPFLLGCSESVEVGEFLE
jgi:hypothetical protein